MFRSSLYLLLPVFLAVPPVAHPAQGWFGFVEVAAEVIDSTPVRSGRIDINHSDARAIAVALAGVDARAAARIVSHRRQHGPFRSLADLLAVPGLAPEPIIAQREWIAFDAPGFTRASAVVSRRP